MANNIGFDHQSGAPTRPYGRQANDISIQDLVARPTAGDTFEMEQRCLLYISGTLCDGKGGVGRVACLQPLGSLQHHMPGKYPVLKTKESTALSPDCGDSSHQMRKNTYIRFQAGHGTPLAETLLTPALQADQRSRTTHTHIHTTRTHLQADCR